MFAPDEDVIVEGDAEPIVTPDGVEQFEFELVREIQKTTDVSAPG